MDLVCDAFACRPSEAVEEMDQDDGLLWQVLDVRAFRAAHEVYRAYEKDAMTNRNAKRPMGPMFDRILQARYARLASLKRGPGLS